MTNRPDIEGFLALAEKATPGLWFSGDDGWPYRDADPNNLSRGMVNFWDTAEPSDPETNPYHPSTVSFPTLAFVCAAKNTAPSIAQYALDKERECERLRGLLKTVSDYSDGKPPYRFDGPDDQRSNEAFDAWQAIRAEIDAAIQEPKP